MILTDPAAERGVLAGIFTYGADAYFDVADILSENTFQIDSNAIIFKCLKTIIEEDNNAKIDIPSIYSVAQRLEVAYMFKKDSEAKHLRAIMDMPVNLQNVRKFAGNIRKLEIARLLHAQLEVAQDKILNVQGSEPITQILGMAEDTIFDFTSLLNSASDEEPQLLTDGITEYFEYLADNPVETMGISTGYPAFDASIGGGLRKSAVSMIGARTKVGKAQSLDSTIWTPTGPVKMKDIKIGQVICHPTKGTTKVIAIHPQGQLDKYKVTFTDGSFTECCGQHLWQVTYRKKWQVINTYQIISRKTKEAKNRTKWHIPLTEPVNFINQPVKIPPYMMGLMIGDGSFRNCVSITTTDKEISDYVKKNVQYGYKIKQNGISYYINNGRTGGKPNKYREVLKEYGLWMKDSHSKFIPTQYLYNTINKRWKLLQGLMDTDGSVSNKCLEYTTVSEQLAQDVQILVQSLGGIATIKSRTTSCNGKKFNSFRLRIAFQDNKKAFRLSRKVKKASTRTKETLKRGIEKIEYIGKDEMQCITVDNSDGLYLTDSFIVTHNSQLAINIANHVAKNKIPVLYLDTEMIQSDQRHRLMARLTETEINDLETGQFGAQMFARKKVLDMCRKIEQEKYALSYKNISGKPFEEIISIARRWLMKVVGVDENGKVKDCLIIYDYLKLMSADGLTNDLKEYQLLGFMMTALHNFAVRYDIPILSFIQLNRDGITKESTDAASGSDRIVWLCSNFSLYKFKSDEDIAQDGLENGNRKLVPLISRHGPGMENGNYINMQMVGKYCKIEEGRTAQEVRIDDEGFIDDDNEGNFDEFDALPFGDI